MSNPRLDILLESRTHYTLNKNFLVTRDEDAEDEIVVDSPGVGYNFEVSSVVSLVMIFLDKYMIMIMIS